MIRMALLLAAGCACSWAAVNQVEPLSNGLALSMSRNDIVQKFGRPTQPAPGQGTLAYSNFLVQLGSAQEIQSVVLKKLVRLNCGIGPGSSRSNVIRTFGAPFIATTGQYELAFSYSGDRVSAITIKPVNGRFTTPAHHRDPVPLPSKGLPGTWYGTGGTAGLIEILPDGTYKWNGAAGHWSQHGRRILFRGPLEAWNHGRALLKNGSIDFPITGPGGDKHEYTFAKLL